MKKGFLKKSAAGVIAGALALTMAVGLMQPAVETYAAEKVADLDTTTKYTESLGDNASTEYAGRIWSDKTVYDEDSVTFDAYGGAKYTITNDEDFLVAFSALATSQSITGATQAPVDVVFVIDLSGSMSNQHSNMTINGVTKSRIAFTVDAVNEAITTLMRNPYARVAVVGFNEEGDVLLPLDRYTQVNASTPYFTLNTSTASSNNARLTVRAINGVGQTISRRDTWGSNNAVPVTGGTNIQDGIFDGMSLLNSTTSTTATIDGRTVTRMPSMVLLSDGAPTYSMDLSLNQNTNRNWWQPDGYEGPGSSAYAGNGMLAMSVGAYMKKQVDAHYGLTNAANKTTIYTVGMDITNIKNNNGRVDSDQVDLAQVVLNPRVYLDNTTEEYEDSEFAKTILGYWNQYCRRTGDNTPNLHCNSSTYYEMNHPTSGDISGDDLKNYVDAYYHANQSDSVLDIFTNIVSTILMSSPEVPTEHDEDAPMSTGHIIYTDPIGKYMEVKGMEAIIYGGHKYTLQSPPVTSGNTTTYKFTEIAEGNAVYGSEGLEHILITVESTDVGNGIKEQTLVIEIPASLIPIRVNEVTLNSDGSVKTHTNNGAYPIRVLYTVGLQEKVKNADGTVNMGVLSDEYITENLSEETGLIDFYSNLYTGTNVVNGNTAGDTTVEFVAAVTNPFYYMQKNTYILDANGNRVTAIDDDTNYHYDEEFYVGSEVREKAIMRTGAQLKNNTIVRQDSNGHWYRPAGTVRLNRMLTFEGTKTQNATNTAADFYAPTYDSSLREFKVYLGNNGVLSMEATGALVLSKNVTAADGLTAPDKEFTFTVELDDANNNALTNNYNYVIIGADGTTVSTGTITNDGTLALKAGQSAKIYNLPPGTQYTVVESAVAGFATKVNGETGNVGYGIITAGETENVLYENHYNVEPLVVDAGLKGTKILGRTWDPDVDKFTFSITAYNNAPMPENSVVTVDTLDADATATNQKGSFDFGTITFTDPGTYRYTIVEREPENNQYVPGITYSRALYRVVIEITDNGNGTMSAVTDIQKLYTDDATALFTYNNAGEIVVNDSAQDEIVFVNTYDAEHITRVPVALKSYTDNSGMNPLRSGMFTFRVEPVGRVEDNNVVPNTKSENPMPYEGTNKLTYLETVNEGGNVTFPAVMFEHTDIPAGKSTVTYRYKMYEVIPSEATESNNYTVDGMTYDPTVHYIDLVLSMDNSVFKVDANYLNERVAEFRNEYNETPVVVGDDVVAPLQGTKTLTGRDMKTDEVFTFNLTAADAATVAAINSNAIKFEQQIADATKTLLTATVTGDQVSQVKVGQNGVPAAFQFDKITFTKQGTYKFNISEVIPADTKGITYDTHVCTVTIVVEDKLPASTGANDPAGDGKLEATVTYSNNPNGPEFKNTYKATFDKSTAFDLYGTKALTGRPLYEGDFFFSVENTSGARAVPLVSNKADTTDADNDGVYEGAITFLEDQEYTAAGDYVYIIKEQIPTGHKNNVFEGVTYTTVQYKVTVPVKDDLNGRLYVDTEKVVVELSVDGGVNYTTVANKNIVFSNSYTATPDYYVTSPLNKELTGERATDLAAGEFSFIRKVTYAKTLANEDVWDGIQLLKNKHSDGEQDVVIEDPQGSGNDDTKKDIVTNAADGSVTFGDIRFTKKGVYIVEVSEIVPTGATPVYETIQDENDQPVNVLVGYEKDGITYDIQTITRTFRVVDNEEGQLIVEVIGLSGATDLTFTNHYDTTGNLPGATNLNVTKQFRGREWTTDDQFTFLLVGHDAATRTAIANGTVELPETSEALKTSITGLVANVDHVAAIELGYNDIIPADISGTGDKVMTTVNEAFGDITFNLPGTYIFHIREVAGTDTKMTYDTEERIITVTATDNGDGTITADVTSVKDGNGADITLTFTNTYEPNDIIVYGRTNLHVSKELVGRDWTTTDAFTFTLEPATDDANLTGVKDNNNVNMSTKQVVDAGEIILASPTTITVNSGNKDYIHFGNVTFKEAGTFKFNVKETIPTGEDVVVNLDGTVTKNGITYDGTTKTVVVTVTYNDGVFAATVSGDKLAFENTYDHGSVDLIGSTNLKVNKTLTGRGYEDGETFKFSLTPVANDSSTTGLKDADNNPISTADAIAAGMVTMGDSNVELPTDGAEPYFGDITFEEPGVYKFVISEEIPADADKVAGMTYDTHTEIVTVTVEDSGLGYLTVSADTPATGVTFTNTYKASAAELTIPVTKVLDGRKIKDGENFEFIISNAVGAPLPANVRTSVIGDGTTNTLSTSFGKITYNTAGTYVYIIYEAAGTAGGVSYDTTSYRVTVVVSEKIENGKHTGELEAKITKWESRPATGDVAYVEITDPAQQEIVFNNTYSTTEATYATANLGLKKVLEGKVLTANAFDFTLEAVANPGSGMTLPENTVVGNAADGKIDFGTIKFTKADTYTVKVTENVPTGATAVKDANDAVIAYVYNGVTYDIHEFTATFKVTDNGNGRLIVSVTDTSGSKEFKNTYSASGILEGETFLRVWKNFTGRANDEWTNDDKFKFVLEADSATTSAAVTAGTVKLPNNASGIEISKSDAPNYQKAFGNIEFTETGVYKFHIREIAGTNTAITYDATARTITVKVTDPNGDGKLNVGVTYDGADSQDSANIQSYMTFNNHYDPDEIVLYGHDDLMVSKTFTGRENNEWLDSDAFTFVLEAATDDNTGIKDTNGNPMSTAAAQTAGVIEIGNASVTITKDSTDTHFGNIVFHKAGTYTFNVTEEIPDKTNPVYGANNNVVGYLYNGITYSADVKTITVTVTDTGNTLSMTHNLDQTELTFTNTYGVNEETYDMSGIVVEKIFLGRDWKDSDQFTFTLKANDTVTETAIAQGKVELPTNAAGITIGKDTTIEQGIVNHKAIFGNITFKAIGNYSFIIEEAVPTDRENINYSTHKIVINISVTDNGTGNLVASAATSTSIIGNNIPFINTYTPDPVTVDFSGTKKITGRDFLETDEFWFRITAKDNAPLPAVTEVAATGDSATVKEINFGTVTYQNAGTYVYTIEEVVKDKIAGITYDSNEVTVKVEVTYDSQTGTLSKKVTSTKAAIDTVDENNAIISFENSYTPDSTTITLGATKQVTDTVDGNYTMAKGDFVFAVVPSKDNPSVDPIAKAIVTNEAGTENGDVHTGKIFLSVAGTDQFTYTVPGTYVYKLYEATAEKFDHFMYDDAEYTVTVVVSEDQEKAVLTSDVAISRSKNGQTEDWSNKGILFENNYAAPNTFVILEGRKELTGVSFAETDEFRFMIEAQDTKEGDAVITKAEETPMPGNTDDQATPSANSVIVTCGPTGAFRFDQIKYRTTGKFTYKITEVLPAGAVEVTNPDNSKSYKLNGVTYDRTEYTVIVEVTDIAASSDNTAVVSVNKPEVCKLEEGCILEAGHEDECFVPCTIVEGCTLATGHEDECFVPCTTEEGCTLAAGHEDECFVPCTVVEGCTLAMGHSDECQFENPVMPLDLDEEVPANDGTEVPANDGTEVPANDGTEVLANDGTEVPASDDEEVPANDGTEVPASDDIPVAKLSKKLRALFMVATGGSTDGESDSDDLQQQSGTANYGQLHAEVTVLKAGTPTTEGIVFKNTYKADPVEVTVGADVNLPIKKEMDGRTLTAGEFKFKLEPITAGAPIAGTDGIAENDADGNVKFATMTFTKENTYFYSLKEVMPEGVVYDQVAGVYKLNGVTYDAKAYVVKITVSEKVENGKKVGELEAAVEYLYGNNSLNAITFENSYTVDPTNVEISAKKVLNGRTLNAGEFEFKITAKDNAPLPKDGNNADVTTVKNDADGAVKFGNITFTQAGEYKYTIEEIKGALSRVTYDTSKYEVVINVTDNGDGTFGVDVKYYKDGSEVSAVEFTNTYKKPSKPKDPDSEDEPEDEPEVYPAPTPSPVPTPAKTGDSANLGGLIGLIVVAVAGFFGIKTYKRKKQ